MAVKLAFGIPIFLGIVVALIIGIQTSWTTDLWGLALFMGVFLGLVLGFTFHRAQKGIQFLRRSGERLGAEESVRTKVAVELIIFVVTTVCIALPISGKRGILIGGQQVTIRSILIVGAILIATSLIAKLLRFNRHN